MCRLQDLPPPPHPQLGTAPQGPGLLKRGPQRDPHQQEALPPPPRSSHLFPRRAHLGIHPLALLQVALPGVLQRPDRMDSEDPLPTAPVLGTPPGAVTLLGQTWTGQGAALGLLADRTGAGRRADEPLVVHGPGQPRAATRCSGAGAQPRRQSRAHSTAPGWEDK